MPELSMLDTIATAISPTIRGLDNNGQIVREGNSLFIKLPRMEKVFRLDISVADGESSTADELITTYELVNNVTLGKEVHLELVPKLLELMKTAPQGKYWALETINGESGGPTLAYYANQHSYEMYLEIAQSNLGAMTFDDKAEAAIKSFAGDIDVNQLRRLAQNEATGNKQTKVTEKNIKNQLENMGDIRQMHPDGYLV